MIVNLVYCHVFVKESNSPVVLLCQYCLVDYYLSKGFVILEHGSKQLSSVLNDVKLVIQAIDKDNIDYVMECTTEFSSVANIIRKLYIQSPLHYVYQQKHYHDKQKEMDALFDEYQIPSFKNIDHPTLIQEWKLNLDAADYEKKYTKK